MKNHYSTLPVFDLLSLFMITTSLSALVLLSFHVYRSSHALILGAIVFLIATKYLRITIDLSDERFNVGIFIILLVALLFRSDPSLFVAGGQDEGLYVNLSSHIEQKGTLTVNDGIRANLNDKERSFYDRDNHLTPVIHQPGIDIRDLGKSEYVFSWYPLHPIWMAIFAKVFGSDNRVYTLLLFSLISIIGFYFLALEISGGHRFAAYLVAVFLAVNPLHVFFSKFPTNEIITLAFASVSVYYLLRFCRTALDGRIRSVDLVLSAGLMGALFFVRINVFLYIFLVLALCLTASLSTESVQIKKYLLRYLGVLCLLFVLSNVYYFVVIPELFKTVWGVFLKFPKAKLVASVSALFAAISGGTYLLVVSKKKSYPEIMPLLKSFGQYLLVVMAILAVASLWHHSHSLLKIMKTTGPNLPSHIPLSWVVQFLSPVGFLVFLGSLYHFGKSGETVYVLIVLFLLLSIIYYAVVLPPLIQIVPYLYFHARFLLTEIVPFAFLLIALFLGGIKKRKGIQYLTISVIICFFAYFSFFQLPHQEGTYNGFYRDITAKVRDQDLLVIPKMEMKSVSPFFVVTPLSYYYERNVLMTRNLEEYYRLYYPTLRNRYREQYVLTSEKTSNDESLEYVTAVSFKYGWFSNGYHLMTMAPAKQMPSPLKPIYKSTIPVTYFEGDQVFYLYKLRQLPFAAFFNRSQYATFQDISEHVSNFYADGWTNGNGVIKNIDYKVKSDDGYLVINTHGFNPNRDNTAKLQLHIYINNGRELPFIQQKQTSYVFSLNSFHGTITSIQITSHTFRPSDYRISSDARNLGIDLDSVKIAKLIE